MNDHTTRGFSNTAVDSNRKNLMFLEVMPRTSPEKAVILEEKFSFHQEREVNKILTWLMLILFPKMESKNMSKKHKSYPKQSTLKDKFRTNFCHIENHEKSAKNKHSSKSKQKFSHNHRRIKITCFCFDSIHEHKSISMNRGSIKRL